jgi:formiminotetrahydrofolate cyclodeaminase
MWIDQFLYRGDGAGGTLAPFAQAISAADLLAEVAKDRGTLSRTDYETVRSLQYQAVLLADLARRLESDFTRDAHTAERAVRMSVLTDADVSYRAKTLMSAFTGAIEAFANLAEVCQALVTVAEGLTVITRPKRRIELVAAVEALRAAAGTSIVSVALNMGRITDAVVYDRLAAVLGTVDETLANADRVSAAIRRSAMPTSGVPAQRLDPSDQIHHLIG